MEFPLDKTLPATQLKGDCKGFSMVLAGDDAWQAIQSIMNIPTAQREQIVIMFTSPKDLATFHYLFVAEPANSLPI